MDKEFFRKYGTALILLILTVAISCIIILFFFKTTIFTRAFSRVYNIVLPFLYGFVIAYLLRPMCVFFERILLRVFPAKEGSKGAGMIRMICIILSLVILLIIIILLGIAVLPQLIASIGSIINRLPRALSQFQEWLKGLDNGDMSHEIVSAVQQAVVTLTERLQNFLRDDLLPTLQSSLNSLTSSFMDLFTFIKNFGIGCIISVYLLSSWEKFNAQGKMLVYSLFPGSIADWIRDELHFTNRMFSGFIVGKLIDSAIIGIICFIFCSFAKTPYTMLVSVIVGLTNIIPFFGPYLGMIPSTLLILTVNPTKALIFLIFILLLQQVDGNILGPLILGDRLGISSFWILFSILFFGSIWGLLGMVIGAPVFAVLYDLIQRAIARGLRHRNRTDLMEEYQAKYAEPEPVKKPIAVDPAKLAKLKIRRPKK